MNRINAARFAKKIKDECPGLKECFLAVVDNDGALVVNILSKDNEVQARYDSGLDGTDDHLPVLAVADELAKELNALGVTAKVQETFGFSWQEGEDENGGTEWAEVCTLRYDESPVGYVEEEIATCILRNSVKFSHLRPEREARAKFIRDALNAYVRTPEGLAAWQEYCKIEK